MKVEPECSKKTLDEIMARQPGFVWPHLDLVELESLPGRRDPGPIESHLKAFLRVCPECPMPTGISSSCGIRFGPLRRSDFACFLGNQPRIRGFA